MLKNILGFIILLLCISCNNNVTTEVNNTKGLTDTKVIHNMDWLLGNWERMGEEEGKITHEHWNKISDGEYKGLGCTLVGKDTVWQEKMLLIKRNEAWSLEIIVPNTEGITAFELTDLTRNSFVCENDKNEFPKKIEYYKEGEQLKAKISGGGPEIPFQFKKI